MVKKTLSKQTLSQIQGIPYWFPAKSLKAVFLGHNISKLVTMTRRRKWIILFLLTSAVDPYRICR